MASQGAISLGPSLSALTLVMCTRSSDQSASCPSWLLPVLRVVAVLPVTCPAFCLSCPLPALQTGTTCLGRAAKQGNVEVVRALLAAGSTVDHTDMVWSFSSTSGRGATSGRDHVHPRGVPQHCITHQRLLQYRRTAPLCGGLLGSRGLYSPFVTLPLYLPIASASPCCLVQWGRTALRVAARWGHTDCVKALLTAGASRDQPDMVGSSVFKLQWVGLAASASRDEPDMVVVSQSWGARRGPQEFPGTSNERGSCCGHLT